MNEDQLTMLEAKQTVRERPFRSDVPIIGPFVVWFRETWNSVSTKWYVRPLQQQQNEFNETVVRYLREIERTTAARLGEIDDRLIYLDRDQTALTRSVAELTYQLNHMKRLLATIEARLAEQDSDKDKN